MAITADKMQEVAAGDQAFYRVDTRRPPHELEAGMAADAVNCRFEDGRAWPRLCVNQQPWGALATQNPCAFARFNDPQAFDTQVVLTDDWRDAVGEDGGRGRAWRIQSGNIPQEMPLNGNDVWDTSRLIQCYNGLILLRQGNERHYFSATRTLAITGSDATADTLTVDTATLSNGLVASVTGITGASGSYYVRLAAGGAVALYDTLAHANAGGATGLFDVTVGSETGTLSVLAVDPATSRIQLNCAPDWVDGDRVVFYADNSVTGGSFLSGTTPPQTATAYFVKNIAGNIIELYTNPSLGTQTVFTSAQGRFWIERSADFPGFYGNAAPPLLAQPDGSGSTIWETGFKAVPVTINVTGTAATTNIVTAPNHRLLPGDHVDVTGLHTTGPTAITAAYVYPISPNAVIFYATSLGALAQDAADVVAQVGSETGTMTKAGASGLPMPGGREGAYYQNRLLIVNGRDTVAISDALDPLHFTPFTAAVTANQGESDQIMALWPLGTNDAVLVLKENSIGLINNFSGGTSQWTYTTLTREYGCLAPLSVAQVGADVWFLSRKGVASISQTSNGVLQGVADPVSKAMQKYMNQIDWRYAAKACAGYWNNRYFIALPLKVGGVSGRNNGLLVHNFLNVTTTNSTAGGETATVAFGWEGLWSGATLLPFAFARLNVYGDERLCFVDYAGRVSWLGDGWADGTTAIATSLTTRRYGGVGDRILWLSGRVTVDAWAPTLTVKAIFPGVNEIKTIVAGKTFDKTKYGVYGLPDYNPATPTSPTFNAPYREDYQPSITEMLAGAQDIHQNHPLPLRLRRLDWGVQLQISNTTGSARIQSVEMTGVDRELTSSEAV